MKKLIYICVFNSSKYVEMLFLLLESIYLFGRIDEETDIMIYTSTEFKNIIEQSEYHRSNIKYRINDEYNNIHLACRARLDLFQLEDIEEYERILYLDTDIIIQGDLKKIFDVVEDNIIYAMNEGYRIDSHPIYWGQDLFIKRGKPIPDILGFSSGVMLFNNCERIRSLFDVIKQDMIIEIGSFYDQPFIIYHSVNNNLVNVTLLVPQVTTSHSTSMNNKENIIVHFAGGPGIYLHKLPAMTNYLNELKRQILLNDKNDEGLENIMNEMF